MNDMPAWVLLPQPIREMNEFAIVEIANRHVSDGQIKVNIKEATTTFIA
jgi:hypothetical protein